MRALLQEMEHCPRWVGLDLYNQQCRRDRVKTKAIGGKRTDNFVSYGSPEGWMAMPKQERTLPFGSSAHRG
jgi:hypothetical protein